MRTLLEKFIDQVIMKGAKYLQVDPFIELTKCAITPIRELAMKGLILITDRDQVKDKIDIQFHTHVPYLIKSA